MTHDELPIERIQALALEPGDILIFTVPADTTDEQIHELASIINERFPDQKHLIVGDMIEVAAYRPVDTTETE